MSGPMNAEGVLSCPQCATARDIYRYCMNCGFDFAQIEDFQTGNDGSPIVAGIATSTTEEPPAAAEILGTDESPNDTAERPAVSTQPVLPPPADSASLGSQLVGGSSAPVMLGIIAGAVCLLLVIVAAILSVIGDDDEPSDSASQATSSPTADDSPAPSTTGEECWDGSQADTLNSCPIPSGTAGLAWVFPSFDPAECTDKTEGAQPPRWNCSVTVDGGGKVRVRYREHGSLERGLATYSQDYGVRNRSEVLSPREDVERYVWRAPSADNFGFWSVSSMYAEHPWSVTVKGRASADVEAVFADVVEFRNPRRIPG